MQTDTTPRHISATLLDALNREYNQPQCKMFRDIITPIPGREMSMVRIKNKVLDIILFMEENYDIARLTPLIDLLRHKVDNHQNKHDLNFALYTTIGKLTKKPIITIELPIPNDDIVVSFASIMQEAMTEIKY